MQNDGHVTCEPVEQPPRQVAWQPHELAQLMPLPQPLAAPHSAVQNPTPHWMPPPQLPDPVQLAMQSPPVEQFRPLPHVDGAVHDSSHRSAVHRIWVPHALMPPHSTMQTVPVHVTPLVHALAPHVTWQ